MRDYCDTMTGYGYSLNFDVMINKAECGTLVATHATQTLDEAERLVDRYKKMNGLTANVRVKVDT